MKIWFDLSNSPHVNMFYDLIREFEMDGHEIIITCRPLANTIDLLKQKNLNYDIVGIHYGKNIFKKIFGFPIRIIQLRNFLVKIKPDISVSQSSFHSPIVARLLGIPSIYTNDNEHALGNLGCFYFATKIFIPEYLTIESIVKKGAKRNRVLQYPGVKEGFYLWRKAEAIYHERMKMHSSKVKIYVRPEPVTAQYYKGESNFMDNILEELQKMYSVTILCRNKEQFLHYQHAKFFSLNVPIVPLEFDQIAGDCTLFIGAGGSMTRELAILGIPTISVYQDKLLAVDKYLVSRNALLHLPNLKLADVINHIKFLENKNPDSELMIKGEKAYSLFKKEILKYDTNLLSTNLASQL